MEQNEPIFTLFPSVDVVWVFHCSTTEKVVLPIAFLCVLRRSFKNSVLSFFFLLSPYGFQVVFLFVCVFLCQRFSFTFLLFQRRLHVPLSFSFFSLPNLVCKIHHRLCSKEGIEIQKQRQRRLSFFLYALSPFSWCEYLPLSCCKCCSYLVYPLFFFFAFIFLIFYRKLQLSILLFFSALVILCV